MFSAKFTGVSQIFRNLRARSQRDNANAERGLKSAGLFIIRESLKIIPIEHGVLKSTWFVRMVGKGMRTRVFLGYTASYAIYVHEDMDAAHGAAYNAKYAADITAGRKKPRGPNQQSKFLERPAREKRQEALSLIRRAMAS